MAGSAERPEQRPLPFDEIKERYAGDDSTAAFALVRTKRIVYRIAQNDLQPDAVTEMLSTVPQEFQIPDPDFENRTIFDLLTEAVQAEIEQASAREVSLEQGIPVSPAHTEEHTTRQSAFLGFDADGNPMWREGSAVHKAGPTPRTRRTRSDEHTTDRKPSRPRRPRKEKGKTEYVLPDGYVYLNDVIAEFDVPVTTARNRLRKLPAVGKGAGGRLIISREIAVEEIRVIREEIAARDARRGERARARASFTMPAGYIHVIDLADELGIPRNIMREYLSLLPGVMSSGRRGPVVPREDAMAVIPQLQDELASMEADERLRLEQLADERAQATRAKIEAHKLEVEQARERRRQATVARKEARRLEIQQGREQRRQAAAEKRAAAEKEREAARERRRNPYPDKIAERRIKDEFGVSVVVLDRIGFLEGAESTELPTGRRRMAFYYDRESVTSAVQRYHDLPTVDPDKGIYTPPDTDATWVPRSTLKTLLGINSTVGDQLLAGEPSILVKNARGGVFNVYELASMQQKVVAYREALMQEREERQRAAREPSTIPDGYVRVATLARDARISYDVLRAELRSLPGMRYAGKYGMIVPAEGADEAMTAIRQRIVEREGEKLLRRKGNAPFIGPLPLPDDEFINLDTISAVFGIPVRTLMRSGVLIGLQMQERSGADIGYATESVKDRIAAYRELPVLEGKATVFVDDDTSNWATPAAARRILGTSSKIMIDLVEGAEAKRARWESGEELYLFNINELRTRLDAYRAERSTRRVVHEIPEAFASRADLETLFEDVPPNRMKTILQAGTIEHQRIGRAKVYLIEGVRAAVGEYKAELLRKEEAREQRRREPRPKRIEPTTNPRPDAKQWASLRALKDKFGFSDEVLTRILSDVAVTRWTGGTQTFIYYNIQAATEKITAYKSLPRVDAKVGVYRDPSGDVWIARSQITDRFDLPRRASGELVDGARSITMLTPSGGTITLYNEKQLRGRATNWRRTDAQRAEAKKQERAAQPRQRKASPEGMSSIYELIDLYGVSRSTLTTLLRDVPSHLEGGRYYNSEVAGVVIRQYLAERPAQAGFYFKEGRQWANVNYLHKKFGISFPTIQARLEGVPTSTGIRGTTIYAYEDALRALDDLIKLPQVSKATGMFRDDAGITWAPLSILGQRMGLSYDKLRQYITDVPTISVRSRSGLPTDAYQVDIIERRAAAYISVPTAKGEARTATVAPRLLDQPKMVNTKRLAELYGTSQSTIRELLKGVGRRARGGMWYPEERAFEILDAWVDRGEQRTERARERRTRFTPPEGHVLMEPLLDEFPVSVEVFRAVTRDLPGKVNAGHMGMYYPADAARARLRAHVEALPPSSGRVVQEGVSYISITELRKSGVKIGIKTLQDLLAGVPSIDGKSGNNKTIPLYDETQARELIAGWRPYAENLKGQGATYWESLGEAERLAEFERRAREFLGAKKGNRLASTDLTKEGEVMFLRAIGTYYPGGLEGLRIKLGVGDTVKAPRDWSDPVATIRREVEALLREKDDFSSTDINNMGMWEHVRDDYPGGYTQLRLDFGLKIKRVESGSITPESIRAEVMAVIKEHGGFSWPIAEEIGAIALMGRVRTRYPGGLQQLLEDVGLGRSRKVWTDEIIEEAALEIYLREGRISNSLLEQVSGLKMAIYKKYEGKLPRLKARVEQLARERRGS